MLVGHNDLVAGLIVGFGLLDAEGDAVGLRVCVNLVAAALHDLRDTAFQELDLWCWVTLHH